MKIKKILRKIGPLRRFVVCIRVRWAESMLKKKGYIHKLKGKKAIFFLPYIKTDELQYAIYYNKSYYENDYLDFLCDKWHGGIIGKIIRGGTILDIGSNIGNHTLYFLLERGASFSHCFEPAKDTFAILEKNIEINKLQKYTKLYNVGVGKSRGNAFISKSKEKNTAYTEITLKEDGDIQVVSIDELDIKDKISFVKIDVEGFENDVLKGMIKTIERDSPFIMIEIWKRNYSEVESLFNSIGYKVELMLDDKLIGDYLCYKDL